MPGTYEHVLKLEIDEKVSNVPSIFGIDTIVESEINRLRSRLRYEGSVILNELGQSSQTIQQSVMLGLNIWETGNLYSSIEITGSGTEVHIGTSVYYASYVHDGHGATVHLHDRGGGVHNYGTAEPRPWSDIAWEMFEPSIDGAVNGMLSKISL